MGEEIKTSHFSAQDFQQFDKNLRDETNLLGKWFQAGSFHSCGKSAGFELEAWLVDENFEPSPQNESLLKRLHLPGLVSELSRFNLEINSAPHGVDPNILNHLQTELENFWALCEAEAHKLHSEMLMIGTLPTLREEMLNLQTMSPLERYHALNEQVLRLRHGRPLHLDIEGHDHLVTTHSDVMLESAGTSLQIHMQMEPKEAVRFFNAAHILAAPMVAVAANSPFLFGKDLWDETRIPLFEQAVDLWSIRKVDHQKIGRVTFGSGYIQESLFECFLENLHLFPVMLPILFDDHPSKLSHLRLHNGTIWRWNRPLIGVEEGTPHLRLEHRVAAAGPSIVDVVANIAFFLGCLQEMGSMKMIPEKFLPFSTAKENFYSAAKDGLRAKIHWLDNRMVPVQRLLLEVLLPMAEIGLEKLGVKKADIEFYLKQIMKNRIWRGYNGSAWQRAFVAKHGADFSALTAAYAEHQHSGQPVHEWKI